MFAITLHPTTRSIRVESTGIWTSADADCYVARFGELVHVARRDYGRVKVLVDARKAAPHRPEIAVRLSFLGKLFRPGDRLAVVLASSIAKQQSREGMPAAGTPFLSIEAAELWLAAHDEPEAAA